MSDERKTWMTPMSYHDDRFEDPDPGPAPPEPPLRRPKRDAYDQVSEEYLLPNNGESPPRKWDDRRFRSLDDEPLSYRSGDPNAEFGLDDGDEIGEEGP